jgi:hypothetical protein
MIKNSLRTITEQFSVERMLIEYVEKMYLPAARAAVSRSIPPVSAPAPG